MDGEKQTDRPWRSIESVQVFLESQCASQIWHKLKNGAKILEWLIQIPLDSFQHSAKISQAFFLFQLFNTSVHHAPLKLCPWFPRVRYSAAPMSSLHHMLFQNHNSVISKAIPATDHSAKAAQKPTLITLDPTNFRAFLLQPPSHPTTARITTSRQTPQRSADFCQ